MFIVNVVTPGFRGHFDIFESMQWHFQASL